VSDAKPGSNPLPAFLTEQPPESMAGRVAGFDWSRTPVGPIEGWPAHLAAAVGICLGCRFPAFVWWGPDLINIYNDAYAQVLGNKHPDALGRPAAGLWSEIWAVISPQADAVMRDGQSTWNQCVPLTLQRNGFAEQCFFSWSYSPAYDRRGRVAGLFCVCIEETVRVLAERERDRLESQRQIALDAADLGWWHYDPATGAASYDERYARIFNVIGRARPNEEILKRVHPDDVTQLWEKARAGMDPADPRPFHCEYRIVVDDGSVRWIEAHGSATFEGAGADRRAVSFVGTVADVTARKRDADRARTILETISDAFFAVDRDWGFTYVNPQAETLLGRAPGDLLGRNIWDEFSGLRGSAFEPAYRDAIARRVPRAATAYYPDHDRWYEVHLYPAPDGGLSIYFRDVSERNRAEAAVRDIAERLERQSRLFERIASATPDFIYTFDLNGRLLYANRRLLEVWGTTFERAVGKSLPELGYPDWHAQMHLRELRQVIDTKQQVKGEVPFTGGSGISGWYEYIFTPVLGPGREVEVIAGTTRDVSDRKRAEAVLRDNEKQQALLLESERTARSELECAGRMKDEFLATLSHELRTPLNAILGWASILSVGSNGEEDLRAGLEAIQRNARAQTQIIEDLLDMSRIVNGKIRLDVQRLDLAGVLRAAAETIRPAADAKGVRLQTVLDPQAGPVSGDPGRLQQVFWNLINNAVKFTPRGGQVRVLLERVNSHLEATVSDTGEGIDPAFLPFVFDRFRQADASSTRRHGGLGLGLSIVKQLVELHGGNVRVKSAGPGQGSTFTVSLPLTVVHETGRAEAVARRHPATGGEPPADPDPSPKLTGVRVLVVDDEPDARELIRRLLADCDAVVRVAGSVDEALDVVAAAMPDVLVSDIGLPGKDGYDLIRAVRALDPARGGTIPAVALTAYARSEDRVRALRAGFQTHVIKPVEPAELLAVVASLAGRVGTRR
jgi:PAS domain S-box-containing protein